MTGAAGGSDHLQRLTLRLPRPLRRSMRWVLQPSRKWLRLPLGGALVAGGLFGFLPILGFWMVPLGALLLAEDIPAIRKPTIRAIDAVERSWRQVRPRSTAKSQPPA